jgi:hypothetical protein
VGHITELFGLRANSVGDGIIREFDHVRLFTHISINGFKNILPIRKAVSDKNGLIELYLDKDNIGGHSIVRNRGGRKHIS